MMPAAYPPDLDLDPAGGHRPLAVVLLSPLAFALVFASWTIFAVLGVELKGVLGFGEARFAVLLAMPMAVGGLASLPMAALARRVGGRRVMIACLLLICPFLWGQISSRQAIITRRPPTRRARAAMGSDASPPTAMGMASSTAKRASPNPSTPLSSTPSTAKMVQLANTSAKASGESSTTARGRWPPAGSRSRSGG